MAAERLQKILAAAGHGSRRACEELIAAGRVRVNGAVATLGAKADPARDKITLDGDPVQAEQTVYIVVHKPRGIVSSLEPQGDRRTVRDLVPVPERLYPVGRLDVMSEGLVLLTNDGELTNRLTHPRYGHEKEYRVLVIGQDAFAKQACGISRHQLRKHESEFECVHPSCRIKRRVLGGLEGHCNWPAHAEKQKRHKRPLRS